MCLYKDYLKESVNKHVSDVNNTVYHRGSHAQHGSSYAYTYIHAQNSAAVLLKREHGRGS